jgi:hypothetical protein
MSDELLVIRDMEVPGASASRITFVTSPVNLVLITHHSSLVCDTV